ncbi:hypothetical protein Q8A73_020757 [Channa argus]|nr:hypothetical protein Q8A73_020757 [Channa argus]
MSECVFGSKTRADHSRVFPCQLGSRCGRPPVAAQPGKEVFSARLWDERLHRLCLLETELEAGHGRRRLAPPSLQVIIHNQPIHRQRLCILIETQNGKEADPSFPETTEIHQGRQERCLRIVDRHVPSVPIEAVTFGPISALHRVERSSGGMWMSHRTRIGTSEDDDGDSDGYYLSDETGRFTRPKALKSVQITESQLTDRAEAARSQLQTSADMSWREIISEGNPYDATAASQGAR